MPVMAEHTWRTRGSQCVEGVWAYVMDGLVASECVSGWVCAERPSVRTRASMREHERVREQARSGRGFLQS